MLDQLEAQPGERILELGAGTGYNAALLAHLVGEGGHVTTIDVDDDLVEGARAHLAAAGFTNVEAVTRDGAVGYAEGAPYDRIIATVGAHGVPHAWLDQLAPGGRLLVPQRLKGSVSRSIAYEQRDGRWVVPRQRDEHLHAASAGHRRRRPPRRSRSARTAPYDSRPPPGAHRRRCPRRCT